MKLADTHYDNSETGCCARLDRELWDEREFDWKDKPFLKDHIRSFLHVPLNFGSVISRDHKIVEDAEAYPEEPLWLTEEVSPWGADVYLATDREVKGATMKSLSGKFLSKVFEGPYRDVGKWEQQVEDFAKSRGYQVERA